MKKILTVIFLSALILCGCRQEPVPPEIQTVIEADILYKQNAMEIRRQYRNPEKIRVILSQIRMLNRPGAPRKPIDLFGDSMHIRLLFSGGREKSILIRSSRYLSVSGAQWVPIKEAQAAQLPALLRMMESDY